MADGTVGVLGVVSVHEGQYPYGCNIVAFNDFVWVIGRVFQGAKQVLCIGLVVADRGGVERRCDPGFCSAASMVAPFIGLPLLDSGAGAEAYRYAKNSSAGQSPIYRSILSCAKVSLVRKPIRLINCNA